MPIRTNDSVAVPETFQKFAINLQHTQKEKLNIVRGSRFIKRGLKRFVWAYGLYQARRDEDHKIGFTFLEGP